MNFLEWIPVLLSIPCDCKHTGSSSDHQENEEKAKEVGYRHKSHCSTILRSTLK